MEIEDLDLDSLLVQVMLNGPYRIERTLPFGIPLMQVDKGIAFDSVLQALLPVFGKNRNSFASIFGPLVHLRSKGALVFVVLIVGAWDPFEVPPVDENYCHLVVLLKPLEKGLPVAVLLKVSVRELFIGNQEAQILCHSSIDNGLQAILPILVVFAFGTVAPFLEFDAFPELREPAVIFGIQEHRSIVTILLKKF